MAEIAAEEAKVNDTVVRYMMRVDPYHSIGGGPRLVKYNPEAITQVRRAQVSTTVAVHFEDVIARWAKERKRDRKAVQDLITKVGRPADVGHWDMARVTRADAIAFKDYLVDEANLSSKSIGNYIKSLKSIFAFAFVNDMFPQIGLDSYGRRSGTISNVLSSCLRQKVGITDPRKPFYSRRHTVITMLRNATTVKEDVERYLVGYARAGEHGNYGE